MLQETDALRSVLMKKITCIVMMLISMLCFSGAVFAAEYIYSSSVDGELSLYISPDDESYEITKVPACSKLKLLDTRRTWGLVEFENKAGWINLSFTRENYTKAAEATGRDSLKNVKVSTKEEMAILYNVPSENVSLGSEQKYQIPDGTVLKITRETSSGWGLVSMNGKYAWIQMDKTAPHTAETDVDQYGIYYVYVLSDGGRGLELWGNEKGKNLCAVIPDCIKLTVRETRGNYGYVSYDGISGWIDLNYTTESLSNAQLNAGVEVNVECTVVSQGDSDRVDMLSIPSANPGDGGGVVSSLSNGEAVFVLRSTLDGWSLVYHDGNLGWLPPQTTTVAEVLSEDIINVYKTPQEGFVATVKGKGLKLFSSISEKDAVATVPEATKIKVIAEKDGYKYVYCDYAAGWAKDTPITDTYEEALEKYPDEKRVYYVTDRETNLMSLPTGNELCGSEILESLPKGKYVEAVRMVTTSDSKWLLVRVDGKSGWIKMNHADKAKLPVIIMLLVILAVAVILVISAIIVRRSRRKRLLRTK